MPGCADEGVPQVCVVRLQRALDIVRLSSHWFPYEMIREPSVPSEASEGSISTHGMT